MAVDLCMKNEGGCSRLMEYYNRRKKRACKTIPVEPIILKKNNKRGFRFSDYCRRRKSACKSKVVFLPREDDVNLHLVLRKRKLDSTNHVVLRDSELESKVFAFESASDYSDKKQAIEESLARICSSEDALRECGRLDNYERLEGISRGGFGAVYRARDKRTGGIVAMKEQYEGMSMPTLREIDIFKSLGPHPSIIEFKEVVADDSDGVYIIMECAEYDLHGYMEEKEDLMSAAEVKSKMFGLFEVVKFLHQNRVMHRDLKPSNILIDARGMLKICDFGLSRRIDSASGLYAPRVGTGWYRAPELLMGVKAYSEAVDMWALGCIMAEMLLRYGGGWEAGRLETICRIVGDGGYDRLQCEFFPAEVVTGAGFDLLKRLLCCEASKRITAEDALKHAWFKEEW